MDMVNIILGIRVRVQYISERNTVFLLLSAVLFSFYISGCATSENIRYYFYEGMPRPREDVALIVMQPHLYPVGLISLTSGENLYPYSAENPCPMKMPYTFDLTPGGYTLRAIYFHNSVAVGDPINFDIHAEPGKIYYFYYKSLHRGTWQLVMEQLADAKDFTAFKPSFLEDQESGTEIQERAERHYTAPESHSVWAD